MPERQPYTARPRLFHLPYGHVAQLLFFAGCGSGKNILLPVGAHDELQVIGGEELFVAIPASLNEHDAEFQ